MARVARTIDVDVPVRTAYNQWTQFEEFPRFMEGVEEVRQLDDRRLHWRAKIGGKEQEWDAEIREQVPDETIIWVNTTGKENAGVVRFDKLTPNTTRVHLEMSYDPEGVIENIGEALGFVQRRVEGDLQRFKDFIEARGTETGAWRGELENPDAPGGHTSGAAARGEYTELEGKGQHGHMEDRDPRMRQGGAYEEFTNEYPDTSAGMHTPGAMRPGSLSREPEQREQTEHYTRFSGPGVEPPRFREGDDDYPES